jgi:hypothetical protein
MPTAKPKRRSINRLPLRKINECRNVPIICFLG